MLFAKGQKDSGNSCGAPRGGLLSATRPVLASRHRSHHFGGFKTEGEAHDYR
jgi:hypothetical protein